MIAYQLAIKWVIIKPQNTTLLPQKQKNFVFKPGWRRECLILHVTNDVVKNCFTIVLIECNNEYIYAVLEAK